jgi:hypothetical protein
MVGGEAASDVRQELLEIERFMKRRVCQVSLGGFLQVN